MEFLEPLQVIWDYLRLGQPLVKADCIVGFGNFNTDIARRAVELYLAGWATKVLFTGGLGRNTEGILPEPEAVRFAKVAAACGVPERDILLESHSANTKENILFTRETLEKQQIPHDRILGVHQPFMERRIAAAVGGYWPEVHFSVTSPPGDDPGAFGTGKAAGHQRKCFCVRDRWRFSAHGYLRKAGISASPADP